MSRQYSAHERAFRQSGVALATLLAAVLLASPAAATTRAASSPAEAANAAQLCALIIQINTRDGAMKNKRFV